MEQSQVHVNLNIRNNIIVELNIIFKLNGQLNGAKVFIPVYCGQIVHDCRITYCVENQAHCSKEHRKHTIHCIYMDGEKESDLLRAFHCKVIFDCTRRRQRLTNCHIYASFSIFIVLILKA